MEITAGKLTKKNLGRAKALEATNPIRSLVYGE